jgi:hypothetical protein
MAGSWYDMCELTRQGNGKGTAWERHDMCELAFVIFMIMSQILIALYSTALPTSMNYYTEIAVVPKQTYSSKVRQI